jgi:NAD(P)-dependent dehydrogenase (short-subunit alcohol dehydrogenase family)
MAINNKSVAVITGAASGIGQALAVRFAREGVAGIAISDVNESGLKETADLIKEIGVPVSTHVFDVSKLDQVQKFADEVIEQHGHVTHLVNNAGVGLIGTFDQLSIEDFEWLMGINFWGVVYGCKVFLPLMIDQDESHIVNISSVFGIIAPEEQTAYCASKFAVRGFTESAADEWKQQGSKLFDKIAKTLPEDAAEDIINAINSNNPRLLIGKDARAISHVSRLFPKGYLNILERLSGHKMSLRKK